MTGPLAHLTVLDLTRVLAGPWSTQMLADLGADVLKVERPVTGDDTRHWGPPWLKDASGRDSDDSAYFSSANRNKRSLAIDLSSAEGQQIVRELAARSDILVENYKVGDLARYRLSYDELSAINPRLIYCSITGYGQDGPMCHLPGYDFVFQGEGGLMSINGLPDDEPGGGPVKTSIAVTDVLTGLNATIGILAAVEHRRLTGRGQRLDIALLDTIIHFGANQIASYFASGEIPRRWGNRHPNLTPYQTFEASDGHFIVCCGNDQQFQRLCAVIGQPELGSAPEYRRMVDRNQHRKPLEARLQQAFARHPRAYWLQRLAEADIPTGAVNDYRQVFEHPQVKHRRMRVEMTADTGASVSVVRNPIRLSDTPITYRMAPPRRGQHTREVLTKMLGRTDEQIDELADKGVLESPPLATGNGSVAK
ncbi:MAG: CaiB/BaiF CoA-transferase family protein [Burkholderiaceae bacterium]